MQVLPKFLQGGGQRVATQLAVGLQAHGAEVLAVSLYDPMDTQLERDLERAGVDVEYLGKRSGFDWAALVKLRALVRRFRPDVIHSHLHVLPYTYAVAVWCRVRAQVHTVHNLAHYESEGIGRGLRAFAFRRGVSAVSIAPKVSESLLALYGVKPAAVIPNGVDVESFAVDDWQRSRWRNALGYCNNEVVFVTVSGLRVQKNIIGLLRAFSSVCSQATSARLVIVGDGPEREEVLGTIARLGLHGRVKLLGNRDNVAEVLWGSDVFVLFSLWEGHPLSILEAMAASLPVVAAEVGGVGEVVENDVTGRLVGQGDEKALSSVLLDLLRTNSAREIMGKMGKSRVRDSYTLDKMVEGYIALYQDLLRSSSGTLMESA